MKSISVYLRFADCCPLEPELRGQMASENGFRKPSVVAYSASTKLGALDSPKPPTRCTNGMRILGAAMRIWPTWMPLRPLWNFTLTLRFHRPSWPAAGLLEVGLPKSSSRLGKFFLWGRVELGKDSYLTKLTNLRLETYDLALRCHWHTAGCSSPEPFFRPLQHCAEDVVGC